MRGSAQESELKTVISSDSKYNINMRPLPPRPEMEREEIQKR